MNYTTKQDTEWRAASTSWPWTQITWQQLQTKIQENIQLRYPPLIQRETWFNTNKTNTETIPQYIRRIHASMNTSYLDKGLTKNQLLIQKTLSTLTDKKLKQKILQTFKQIETLTYEEYLNFIEVQQSITINSQKINQQTTPCTRCKTNKTKRHTKEQCKAKTSSKTRSREPFNNANQCTTQQQNNNKQQNTNTTTPYNTQQQIIKHNNQQQQQQQTPTTQHNNTQQQINKTPYNQQQQQQQIFTTQQHNQQQQNNTTLLNPQQQQEKLIQQAMTTQQDKQAIKFFKQFET